MAQFPAFPLWTDAYLGDTTHLTTIEHGAYLLLLIVAWRSKDGALPDDENMLARYTKLRLNHWKKMRPILEPFFVVKDGKWIQLRLKDELESVKRLSNSQSRKAKGRWENDSKAKGLENNDSTNAAASNGYMPNDCRDDASPTPTPTPTLEYRFKGKIIALNDKDYETWKKAYFNIKDLNAELQAADDWLDKKGRSDGWFLTVSRWLNKAHQESAKNKKKKPTLNWEDCVDAGK